ncbi:MAG: hypothetical protein LBE62_07610 [Azonexus sp.]|nr:hypothetical protein [Azonexus sp.]
MAIIVLLLLAGLAAAIISLSSTQNVTFTQDVESARADLAAYTGIQWGLNRAFAANNNWCTPPTAPIVTGGAWGAGVRSDLPIAAQTNGMSVSVQCWAADYPEGGATTRVYQIRATACTANPANTCPGPNPTSPIYVERIHEVVVSIPRPACCP